MRMLRRHLRPFSAARESAYILGTYVSSPTSSPFWANSFGRLFFSSAVCPTTAAVSGNDGYSLESESLLTTASAAKQKHKLKRMTHTRHHANPVPYPKNAPRSIEPTTNTSSLLSEADLHPSTPHRGEEVEWILNPFTHLLVKYEARGQRNDQAKHSRYLVSTTLCKFMDRFGFVRDQENNFNWTVPPASSSTGGQLSARQRLVQQLRNTAFEQFVVHPTKATRTRSKRREATGPAAADASATQHGMSEEMAGMVERLQQIGEKYNRRTRSWSLQLLNAVGYDVERGRLLRQLPDVLGTSSQKRSCDTDDSSSEQISNNDERLDGVPLTVSLPPSIGTAAPGHPGQHAPDSSADSTVELTHPRTQLEDYFNPDNSAAVDWICRRLKIFFTAARAKAISSKPKEVSPVMEAAVDPVVEAMELTPDQLAALHVLCQGYCTFIGGRAGTGKTVLLKKACRLMTERGLQVSMCGMTGVAGVNLGGGTLHHTFRVSVNNPAARWNYKALQATDVIVVDEVSMMSALLLEAMDHHARRARLCSLPFGGIQVILSGDFLQLTPGDDDPSHRPCNESPLFHRLVQLQLVTPMRQQGVMHGKEAGAANTLTTTYTVLANLRVGRWDPFLRTLERPASSVVPSR